MRGACPLSTLPVMGYLSFRNSTSETVITLTGWRSLRSGTVWSVGMGLLLPEVWRLVRPVLSIRRSPTSDHVKNALWHANVQAASHVARTKKRLFHDVC